MQFLNRSRESIIEPRYKGCNGFDIDKFDGLNYFLFLNPKESFPRVFLFLPSRSEEPIQILQTASGISKNNVLFFPSKIERQNATYPSSLRPNCRIELGNYDGNLSVELSSSNIGT
jgi:hypothetical protein